MLFWIAILVQIQQVLTWGQLGHMITARIAEIHLNNSQAYQRINENILQLNHLTDGRSNTFIESSSWADDLKSKGTAFWFSWHFSNLQINTDGVNAETKNSTNIMQALDYTFNALSEIKRTPDFQSALFSRFLIHLIGDIHQPLHIVSLFNNTFQQGDAGGNKINIQDTSGLQQVLHTYWDNLFDNYEKITRPLNEQSFNKIDQISKDIMSEFSPEFFDEILKDMDHKKWAQQEYFIAKDQVYGPLIQFNTNIIDQDYHKKNTQYIKHQLALGGYRLSKLIEHFFGEQNKQLLQ